MIAMIPQRWHFDMRCAANANDAPIALKPGLIFFFILFDLVFGYMAYMALS